MRHVTLPMVLVASAAVLTAATQAIPVTTLSKPAAEFPEGFTSLDGLRELPDGRVMTIERCEGVVKLLNLATGVAGMVGRTGAGPGEYRTPFRLLALPGDSSVINDSGNRRYLIIGPDGKPGRFFDQPPAVIQTGTTVMVALGFSPSGTDSLGRFYAREAGLLEAGANLVRAESVAVVRWDHRSGKRDTVAFHRTVRPGPVVLSQPEIPFTTGIQWAVARDGRVALLYPADYHVELVGPAGARVVGQPIAYQRVRVTEGLKTQWREDQKPLCGNRAISMPAPNGQVVSLTPRAAREPAEWPEVVPPFLSGAAVFAPDGLLWVRRTGGAGAPPAYDLIDGKGNVARRVVLPMRARLLGFGRGSVYLVRVDDDDLQYVQRYDAPTLRR